MTPQAAKAATLASGRDALATLRGKAHDLKEAGLPRAASAAESAGKSLSGLALSTSRSLARSLRSQTGGKRGPVASGAALLEAVPLLRTAGRFALRNPAVLAAAGVAIAVIGYSAWRRQQAVTAATAD